MHVPGSLLAVSVLLSMLGFDADRLPPTAQGSVCHTYAAVARQLGATYHETPVSLGVQSNGNLLLVFNSVASGSWTIVSASPTGLTCILAAGQQWESTALARLAPPV